MASSRRIRLDLARNDVALLIDCIEEIIENYKYEGGLILAEDEQRLHELLLDRLHRHDGSHEYRKVLGK